MNKLLMGFAAFFVVYLLVKFIVSPSALEARPNEARVQQVMENKLKELEQAAAINYPTEPAVEGLRQEAIASAKKKLDADTNADTKARSAADMFWGFLFVNTRARLKFCRSHGIDLKPFVDEFTSAHRSEIAWANSIYQRNSFSSEDLYKLTEKQMDQFAAKDMADIAEGQNVSAAGACSIFANEASGIVGQMHLKKTNPTVRSALMNGARR